MINFTTALSLEFASTFITKGKKFMNFKILDMDENLEQERELIRLAKNGNKEAIEKLIKAHERYIEKRVNYYLSKMNLSYSFLKDDLLQEGRIALLKAIKNFDLTMQNKLLTYASDFIDGAIIKFLAEQSNIIKYTMDYVEVLKKIREAKEKFMQSEGREPTIEELSQILNMREETLRKIIEAPKIGLHLEESLDEENDDNRKGEETLDIESEKSLDQTINEEYKLERLKRIIRKILSEREYKIICQYYGIDCEKKTLEDIAKELKISKERARQIKEKAEKKIKFYGDELRRLIYD